jgi:hypothetical protein
MTKMRCAAALALAVLFVLDLVRGDDGAHCDLKQASDLEKRLLNRLDKLKGLRLGARLPLRPTVGLFQRSTPVSRRAMPITTTI